MARELNRLTAVKAQKEKVPGLYADGGGLYLQVAPGGSKSWVFRFKEKGKARDMGLGPLHTVSLAEAREAATECRKLRLQGIDPIQQRNQERAARQLEAAKAMTFDQCAEAYITDNSIAWRNLKHRQQWKNTLATYVSPVIGKLSVQDIDTGLVSKILRPIWTEKPVTGSRVRGRIEAILNWASAHKYRTGDNPARWKGNLDHLMPKHSKVRAVQHHAALPYANVAPFMADLRGREGAAALALQFTILTAARTGEALRAKWSEFDLTNKVWTVPGDRMKAGREHRVPLSPSALALLRKVSKSSQGDYVFTGESGDRPLPEVSMLTLLRRMEHDDITVHGFRSTFKDWARERTSFPNEVSEAALAHTNSDKVEAAYARSDMFDKRRRLMDAWAAYCEAPATGGKVVAINRGARE